MFISDINTGLDRKSNLERLVSGDWYVKLTKHSVPPGTFFWNTDHSEIEFTSWLEHERPERPVLPIRNAP